MAEIIWSPEALPGVNEISDYIAEDSEFFAARIVEAIIARTDILLSQPFSGRSVPESDRADYREVFEYSYRIIYSTELLPDIRILRISHMAQLLKNL